VVRVKPGQNAGPMQKVVRISENGMVRPKKLGALIMGARRRVIYAAPSLSFDVSLSLKKASGRLGAAMVSVVLDVSEEVFPRFCERLGVKFPGPTRPKPRCAAVQQVVGYWKCCGPELIALGSSRQ
jgi:hypothetical protein